MKNIIGMRKRLFSLILVFVFCIAVVKVDTIRAAETGLQTPTGIISGILKYPSIVIQDNPTLEQARNLPNIIEVSKEKNPEVYSLSNSVDNRHYLDASKMGLTGNIYHDVQTFTYADGGTMTREDFIKVLSIKISTKNAIEIVKVYDLVRYTDFTNATSVDRNSEVSTYNAQYRNYVNEELNPPAQPVNPPTIPTKKQYTIKRLAGLNRFDTNIAVANEYNSGAFQNVVISTGSDFPDALAGSVLAKKLNAPILLVGNNVKNSEVTLNYIKKGLAKNGTVYLLGGSGVLSDEFITYFKSNGYNNITRIGGSGREETAKLIADKVDVAKGTPIIIATGSDFADALSISSIAASNGYPILLTDGKGLIDSVKSYISTIQPSKVYIVGGTGVVSDSIIPLIKSATHSISDANITRLAGANRFETSLNITKHFNLDTDNILVSTGHDFPDALTGSILGAKLNAPILLIDSNDTSIQKAYLDSVKAKNIYILGGAGAVSANAENNLKK